MRRPATPPCAVKLRRVVAWPVLPWPACFSLSSTWGGLGLRAAGHAAWQVRGKLHVADAAMWPEAVNKRDVCCGVRFNLATSAHAKLPTDEEEEEEEEKEQAAAGLGAGVGAGERAADEVDGKPASQRGSSPRSSRSPSPSTRGPQDSYPQLVFAERRPPSLPPEEVGPLDGVWVIFCLKTPRPRWGLGHLLSDCRRREA